MYVRAEPGTAARIAAELPTRSGVRRATLVVGEWDVLAVAEAEDMNALAGTVLTEIQATEGVLRTLTAPIVPADRLGAVGGGFGLATAPQLFPGDACYVHIRAAAGAVPLLFERLAEIEAVTGVAALAGPYDLVAEIRQRWATASGIILEEIAPLEGVEATHTLVGVTYEEPEEDRDQFSAWT